MRFEKYDTPYCTVHKGRSGRKETGRSEDHKTIAQKCVDSQSKTSKSKISAETGINKNSVYRILKLDLNFKPFKVKNF